jgi:hypothetical protein
MRYCETEHLRVLIANERKDRLPIVAALGHEVIAREIDVEDVGAVTARERPDVALVGIGASSEHALGLIERIVRKADCPVIALLRSHPGLPAAGPEQAFAGRRRGRLQVRALRAGRQPSRAKGGKCCERFSFAPYVSAPGARQLGKLPAVAVDDGGGDSSFLGYPCGAACRPSAAEDRGRS